MNEPKFHRNNLRPQHRQAFAGAVILFFFLMSCQTAEKKSVTQPPTLPLATQAVRVATLPPTWTPIPTATPSQTATQTPTPTLTVSPTVTATLSAESICDNFTLVSAPEAGVSLPFAGFIAFSWDGSPPDSLLILSVKSTTTDSETLVQFPSAAQRNAYFELYYLPTWGTYRWTLSLFIEPYGELCPISGTFFREAWWEHPVSNPLAPPFIFRVQTP